MVISICGDWNEKIFVYGKKVNFLFTNKNVKQNTEGSSEIFWSIHVLHLKMAEHLFCTLFNFESWKKRREKKTKYFQSLYYQFMYF